MKYLIARKPRMVSAARKMGFTIEEIAHEAVVSLVRAAQLYDPAKGSKFSTYGCWHVWSSLTRLIGSQSTAKARAERSMLRLDDEDDDGVAAYKWAQPASQPDQRVDTEEVERLLAQLPPRIAAVLRMRFGWCSEKPLTLAAIGQSLHLSKERVRQLEYTGLARLRDLMHREGHTAESLGLIA